MIQNIRYPFNKNSLAIASHLKGDLLPIPADNEIVKWKVKEMIEKK